METQTGTPMVYCSQTCTVLGFNAVCTNMCVAVQAAYACGRMNSVRAGRTDLYPLWQGQSSSPQLVTVRNYSHVIPTNALTESACCVNVLTVRIAALQYVLTVRIAALQYVLTVRISTLHYVFPLAHAVRPHGTSVTSSHLRRPEVWPSTPIVTVHINSSVCFCKHTRIELYPN